MALALDFLFRGCFVFPCFCLALGVNRAARAVSFVQIVGRLLELVAIRKKLTKIQQENAT